MNNWELEAHNTSSPDLSLPATQDVGLSAQEPQPACHRVLQ